MRKLILLAIVAMIATIGAVSTASATTTCTFTVGGTTMTLDADCTTDATILVPGGFTLDGAGHTITAVDPVGGHFVGAVVANAGAIANVKNLGVTASGLANFCDAGANRLRGIMFEGASGSITKNRVVGINQGASGCQEGNAIEARNFSGSGVYEVTISDNTVGGYQKTGIVTNGGVSARVTGNTVIGAGPINYIAQNGIQVGWGAKASVMRNSVSGNAYTGGYWASGGILVVGGACYAGDLTTGVQIVGNTVSGNDVGVYLSNLDASCSAPSVQTNVKVVNNVIIGPGGSPDYQAGVSDVGNNDKIVNNVISGYADCDPGFCVAIDADVSFTNNAKVHANK